MNENVDHNEFTKFWTSDGVIVLRSCQSNQRQISQVSDSLPNICADLQFPRGNTIATAILTRKK